MKVLLTGYTGFLGGYLAKALKKKGYDIRILMNRTTKPKKAMMKDLDVIWGSLVDQEMISRATKGVQIVVHSAWSFSNEFTERPTVNEEGTKILFEESIKAGVKKFVFISSVSVFGMDRIGKDPIDEQSPLDEKNINNFIYQNEKIHIEKFLGNYKENNIKIGVFRPGPIFDDKKPPIKKIITISGRNFGIGIGNGKNIIPNIHAEDVAESVIRWLENTKKLSTYNVTPTQSLSTSKMYSNWGLKQGKVIQPLFIPTFFVQFAFFGINIIRKVMNKKKSDIEYAIACATRDMAYSNMALKTDLNWEDKKTKEYSNL